MKWIKKRNFTSRWRWCEVKSDRLMNVLWLFIKSLISNINMWCLRASIYGERLIFLPIFYNCHMMSHENSLFTTQKMLTLHDRTYIPVTQIDSDLWIVFFIYIFKSYFVWTKYRINICMNQITPREVNFKKHDQF